MDSAEHVAPVADAELVPVPVTGKVTIDGALPTIPRAADFGAWTTYTLAANSPAQPVLPFDHDRSRALIVVSGSPTGGSAAVPGGQSSTTTGSQTSPAAGTTITSQALAAGTYVVNWSVQLSGTLGAGDTSNFGLYNGATLIATSLNSGAAGTYPQPTETVVIPGGGATLAVKAIAIGTVGAVYQSQLTSTLQPVAAVAATPAAGGVYVGTQAQTQANPVLGGFLPVGSTTEVKNKQGLWLAPDGTHALTVSVLVERWGS